MTMGLDMATKLAMEAVVVQEISIGEDPPLDPMKQASQSAVRGRWLSRRG